MRWWSACGHFTRRLGAAGWPYAVVASISSYSYEICGEVACHDDTGMDCGSIATPESSASGCAAKVSQEASPVQSPSDVACGPSQGYAWTCAWHCGIGFRAFFHKEVVVGVLFLGSTGCVPAAMRQAIPGASLKDQAVRLCRAAMALGCPVLVLVWCWIFSPTANAQERVTKYCYETCFSSLYEAEAELREKAGPYGNLWRRRETHQYMDSANGPIFMIRYTVDDHSPSILYAPGYVISGWDSRQGICSPAIDPYNATKCANEKRQSRGCWRTLERRGQLALTLRRASRVATHLIM